MPTSVLILLCLVLVLLCGLAVSEFALRLVQRWHVRRVEDRARWRFADEVSKFPDVSDCAPEGGTPRPWAHQAPHGRPLHRQRGLRGDFSGFGSETLKT